VPKKGNNASCNQLQPKDTSTFVAHGLAFDPVANNRLWIFTGTESRLPEIRKKDIRLWYS